MYYVISFDGCGLESPLQSRSIESAVALAEEAQRSGCENVLVTIPGGEALPWREFAQKYHRSSANPNEA